MELEVIKLIKNNENWAEILQNPPYNLTVSYDGNFAILKYELFKNPDFSYKITNECRGLIIDLRTLEPVCVPFYKFFNYGEPFAAEIDWNNCTVQEKYDGSLIKLWYDSDEQLHISTNGTVDAYKALMLPVETSPYDYPCDKTYGEFVYELLDANAFFEYHRSEINTHATHMFELISPYNRIVINYKGAGLIYLGSRDNKTLQEYIDPLFAAIFKMPFVYKLNNLEDCIEYLDRLGNLKHEGFVVCDKDYNRIKIKNPLYIMAHRQLNNSLSSKRLMQLYLSGDYEELLTYFPEYREKIEQQYVKIDAIVNDILSWNKELRRNKLSYADAAKATKGVKYQQIIMMVYKDKLAAEPDIVAQEIKKRGVNQILDWYEYYLDKVLN